MGVAVPSLKFCDDATLLAKGKGQMVALFEKYLQWCDKFRLTVNTLTSIQGFYRVFGSIPVGRLPGTIKGPFKAIRCCLEG